MRVFFFLILLLCSCTPSIRREEMGPSAHEGMSLLREGWRFERFEVSRGLTWDIREEGPEYLFTLRLVSSKNCLFSRDGEGARLYCGKAPAPKKSRVRCPRWLEMDNSLDRDGAISAMISKKSLQIKGRLLFRCVVKIRTEEGIEALSLRANLMAHSLFVKKKREWLARKKRIEAQREQTKEQETWAAEVRKQKAIQARKAAEQKQREMAEQKRRQEEMDMLKRLGVRALRRPRILYVHLSSPARVCSRPTRICAPVRQINPKEKVIVTAENLAYYGIREGAENKASGWIPKGYLVSAQQLKRDIALEERDKERWLMGFKLLWSQSQAMQAIEKGEFIFEKKYKKKCGAFWLAVGSKGKVALAFRFGKLYSIMYLPSQWSVLRGFSEIASWSKVFKKNYKKVEIRMMPLITGRTFAFVANGLTRDGRTKVNKGGPGKYIYGQPYASLNLFHIEDRSLAKRKCYGEL